VTIAPTSQQCPDVSSQQYDLFISYNRNDSEPANQLAHELETRGVRVWLDKLNLPPGDRWQAEIASALAHARAVAVLIGPSGLGGWQELELHIALAKQPERAQRIIPVPLPGAPRAPTLPDLLAPFMHCDLRAQSRSQRVDKLAQVLLDDRQRSDAPTGTGPADWLVRLFQSARKPLMRKSAVKASAQGLRPQAEPAGSRRLFSAEDADQLLQMFDVRNAPRSAQAAEPKPLEEVTQIVPSLQRRSS
jgi:hypothetical protein